MVKLEKKQVKIVSVLIALAFIGSVVALALTQSGSGLASAASTVLFILCMLVSFIYISRTRREEIA